MLFRFLITTLATACVILLVALPLRITVVRPAAVPVVPSLVSCGHEPVPPLAVVDVAHGVALRDLGPLMHLRPGERITAVNDRPTEGRPPIERMRELAPRPGSYLDLTVASDVAERRVLMLLH